MRLELKCTKCSNFHSVKHIPNRGLVFEHSNSAKSVPCTGKMVLSSLFILSPRGDAIISKDFRGDVPKSAIETFFRRVKLDKDAAPVLVRVLGR